MDVFEWSEVWHVSLYLSSKLNKNTVYLLYIYLIMIWTWFGLIWANLFLWLTKFVVFFKYEMEILNELQTEQIVLSSFVEMLNNGFVSKNSFHHLDQDQIGEKWLWFFITKTFIQFRWIIWNFQLWIEQNQITDLFFFASFKTISLHPTNLCNSNYSICIFNVGEKNWKTDFSFVYSKRLEFCLYTMW